MNHYGGRDKEEGGEGVEGVVQWWQGEEGIEGDTKEGKGYGERSTFFQTHTSLALAPVLLKASAQPVWIISNCAV